MTSSVEQQDDGIKSRGLVIYLYVSSFFMHFGFQFWRAVFNNFAVEEIGVGPAGMGWIQSFREIPGLMGFTLSFVVLFFSEVRIVALSLVLLGVGIFATGQAHSVAFLVASTLVMSTGFHYFHTSNNSVVLLTVSKAKAPQFLGKLRGIGALGTVVALGGVYLLSERLGYRVIFMAVGVMTTLAGLVLIPVGGRQGELPPRRRVILRRRYWLYYTLSFLMGCRRHVFTTFAIFLLVRNYGISVRTAAVLFLVNGLINIYALPLVGRFISRIGERLVLSVSLVVLVGIFLGYAYVSSLPLLFVLFVLNNLMFGANIALPTYFQKIAVSDEEITTNVALDQTINHIAAIVIPVIGGIIWEAFSFQVPFLAGAAITVVSLGFTLAMRIPE